MKAMFFTFLLLFLFSSTSFSKDIEVFPKEEGYGIRENTGWFLKKPMGVGEELVITKKQTRPTILEDGASSSSNMTLNPFTVTQSKVIREFEIHSESEEWKIKRLPDKVQYEPVNPILITIIFLVGIVLSSVSYCEAREAGKYRPLLFIWGMLILPFSGLMQDSFLPIPILSSEEILGEIHVLMCTILGLLAIILILSHIVNKTYRDEITVLSAIYVVVANITIPDPEINVRIFFSAITTLLFFSSLFLFKLITKRGDKQLKSFNC